MDVGMRMCCGWAAFVSVGCVEPGLEAIARADVHDALAPSADVSTGTVQGVFVTRIASMYDGSARTSHHLRLPDGEVELLLPTGTQIERDAIVRVHGAPDARGVWQVDDWEIVAPPPSPVIDGAAAPLRNIGAILVFWEEPGLTNPLAKDSLFGSALSTSVFYGENSYGRETVIGEVFGPYQIPDPGGCDPYTIGMNARQAMADNGHDPDAYQQLMYHFPDADCAFAGLADLGSPQFPARDSWYHSSFGCVVRNQELGHNYGMGHSHSYSCGFDDAGLPIVFDTDCEHIEYGDPYDPMGEGCGHINAVQKLFMGWLEGCNLVSTTADGTFNLLPLELPCDGTQALRFPAWDGRWWYLEYRKPIGEFDDSLAPGGVLVHIAGEIEADDGPAPYILDRVGTSGFLHAGESFTDPEGTVSFTVVEELATHAVISVTFPGGGNGSPVCMDGAVPESAAGAVGSLACAEAPYPADDSPPVVTLTYPADGAYFEPGDDFVITADVTDDRVVSDVVLYLDGSEVERLYAPPWEWSVTNIPQGSYEFGVAAHDGRNQGVSEAVDVQVGMTAVDTGEGGVDGSDDASPNDGGELGGDATSADGDPNGPAANDGIDDGCGCTQRGGDATGVALAGLTLACARRRRRRPHHAVA
ncbi:MAG: hypothetical protein IAG13_17250 [Deltaproteobacteria bacterium]|nr:hypothetical protein [Nannocystaceae bacterium]